LHQVGDLFELNAKLRCQKVNYWIRKNRSLYVLLECTEEDHELYCAKTVCPHAIQIPLESAAAPRTNTPVEAVWDRLSLGNKLNSLLSKYGFCSPLASLMFYQLPGFGVYECG